MTIIGIERMLIKIFKLKKSG